MKLQKAQVDIYEIEKDNPLYEDILAAYCKFYFVGIERMVENLARRVWESGDTINKDDFSKR